MSFQYRGLGAQLNRHIVTPEEAPPKRQTALRNRMKVSPDQIGQGLLIPSVHLAVDGFGSLAICPILSSLENKYFFNRGVNHSGNINC